MIKDGLYICAQNMKSGDTYKHMGMRRMLIESLRLKGISDERVLEAMNKIPRHLFMDQAFISHAYEDRAFPIGAGQTISQPYTVAYQTQLLNVEKGHKVLEIGTGSGYQSCVLIEMGVKLFTIERQKELFDNVKVNFSKLGYTPKGFYGDGYKGAPAFAPFDRILVTAGAPFIPEALCEQLKPGGRLVIPVGAGSSQIMTLIEKNTESELIKSEFDSFRFVPLLVNKNWQ